MEYRNSHQGKFGEDYVRVLASAAGLLWSKDDVDVDGVDLCLKYPGRTDRGFSPRIEVQVKTVSTLNVAQGVVRFDGLSRKQFNKLAGECFTVPRYLFVIHVPKDLGDLTNPNPDGLLLRHLGYYLSLDGMPSLGENVSGTRVRLPLSNVLTVSALRSLVCEAA